MAFAPDIAFDYLARAWRDHRLAHAYLVSGIDAPGRRRFAERFVRLVNRSEAATLESMAGEGVTLIEPESKSRRITVDQIRAVEQQMNLKGAVGKLKVGVMVDADRMNPQSTNAFLKTLEEPPPESLLLLLSGSPAQLLDTVISRCIRVSLFDSSASEEDEFSAAETDLLNALARHFSGELSPSRALALLAAYSAVLAGEKKRITEANESGHKKEIAQYSRTTDAGPWLRDRKDHFEALSSAQYRQLRARSLDVLLRWFGDLLRRQAGHPHLDFPRFADPITAAAARTKPNDLLARLRFLDQLSRHYETNVNEALATEFAFLGAFG